MTATLRIATAALILAGSLSAATSTAPASSFGFLQQNGTFASTTNHAVGYYTGTPPGELRNYVVFDLTGLAGRITAAKLRLFNPATGFSSPQPSETFTLFDVTTPVASLTSGGTAMFNDLGTGVTLGSVTVTNASNNTIVEVDLNAQGITYLNSAAGQIAIGGALTTLALGAQSERLFNSAAGPMVRELVVTTDDTIVPCAFTVTQNSFTLPADGGSATVQLNNTAGANCTWNVSGAANWITTTPANGTGSASITLTAAANPSTSSRSTTITIAGQAVSITQAAVVVPPPVMPTRFVRLAPCRLMETRPEYNFEGRAFPFGPPFLNTGETRTFTPSASTVCQVPASARAFVLNVTLVPRGGVDFATVYPAGEARPNYWTVRSPDGQIVANSAIVRGGVGSAISVYVSNNTDIIVDISGYFTENASESNLVYYPLTPCRVVETRALYRPQPGQFGPPSMTARQTRTFRLPQSTDCSIPQGAAAYSVTITVVPPAALAFLTAWPSDRPQPNVSTINSPAGRVLANSVIVPASPDGSINLFAFDPTDVIVDINGYFAPDNGSGLFYYPVTQCRVSNTADPAYTGSFGGPIFGDQTTRTIPVASSPQCTTIPSSARGYALNAVVTPNGNPMPFLTIWPSGQSQPNASVINAFQGQTVASGFLVPAGSNGGIDVFAFRSTHVALEIAGYFGR